MTRTERRMYCRRLDARIKKTTRVLADRMINGKLITDTEAMYLTKQLVEMQILRALL